MSNSLPASQRQDLLGRTASALQEIRVRQGMFLERASLEALSVADGFLKGRAREEATKHLGENPFFEFVHQTLSTELSEAGGFSSVAPIVELSSIVGYENLDSVAERLVRAFESLPNLYDLVLVLPEPMGSGLLAGIGEFRFTNAFRLAKVDDAFKHEFPVSKGINPAFDQAFPFSISTWLTGPDYPTGSAAIICTVSGHISGSQTSSATREAIDAFGSFFGLAMALQLLTRSHYATQRVVLRSFVFERATAGPYPLNHQELTLGESVLIRDLDVDREEDELKRDGALIFGAQLIQALLAKGPAAAKVLLASRWFFTAQANDDELLSFVQIAVVLEVILGDSKKDDDKDRLTVGDRLRTRCAYSIAESVAERERIMNDFKKIYDVRSMIVHSGKRALSVSDVKLYHRAIELSCRMIWKEVKLLIKQT